MSFESVLSCEQNIEQNLSLLFHRILIEKQRGEGNYLTDAILPEYFNLTKNYEDGITYHRPTDFHVTKLSQPISSAAQLRKLCEETGGAARINRTSSPWGEALSVLKIWPHEGCDMVLMIVQSKRKEAPEDREEVDTELIPDYENTIWNNLEEFRTQKILPIFLYLADSTSVQGLLLLQFDIS